MRKDFAIFILSYRRADQCAKHTVKSLQRSGYTGDWYVVCSSDDDTVDEYRREFGVERVYVFDKDDTATDMMDNGGSQGVIVYARNYSAQLARALGYEYYMQLDDDYIEFESRYPMQRENGEWCLGIIVTQRLDDILTAFVEFLESSGALTVALAQGGDYQGGIERWTDGVMRKAMNTFIARTSRPIRFVGRINEDVNTYVTESMRGELFFTILDSQIVQVDTQREGGGMSDAYLAAGTYVKSFYTVIAAPSAVMVDVMGTTRMRMHHHIQWSRVAPKILSESVRNTG